MEIINKNILLRNLIRVVFIIAPFILGYYNYELAKIICSYTEIPFDFTLTMISAGFGLDITIVLTVIEVGLLIWIANKLKLINY